MPRLRTLTHLLPLLLLLPHARCALHPYDGVFQPLGDAFVYRAGREGLFKSRSQGKAAGSHGVADGESFIRLAEVEFIRPKHVAENFGDVADERVTGSLTAVVFKATHTQVSERGLIGYQPVAEGPRRYCCTERLVESTRCTPGQPLVTTAVDGASGGTPWSSRINFMGAREVTSPGTDAKLRVNSTGMFHLWFLTCDAQLAATQVHGFSMWKNPGGYLPGMMAPMAGFTRTMTLAYVLLSCAWLLACAVNWVHTLPLQHCISGVLVLGMAEMMTWHTDHAQFNATGLRPLGLTLTAVLLGACRKTLARVLLLVAAQGYGIVRPTLGEDVTQRISALGLAYFMATCSLETTSHVGTVDDLARTTRVLLVAPVAGLDAVFIIWTFASLSATLAVLSARKAAAPKLALYKRFTNALAAAVTVSIAWIGYETWFKLSDAHNAHWRSEWITAAFWHVLSYALVVAMCLTWAPRDAVAEFVRTTSQHGDLHLMPLSPTVAGEEAGGQGADELGTRPAPEKMS